MNIQNKNKNYRNWSISKEYIEAKFMILFLKKNMTRRSNNINEILTIFNAFVVSLVLFF